MYDCSCDVEKTPDATVPMASVATVTPLSTGTPSVWLRTFASGMTTYAVGDAAIAVKVPLVFAVFTIKLSLPLSVMVVGLADVRFENVILATLVLVMLPL